MKRKVVLVCILTLIASASVLYVSRLTTSKTHTEAASAKTRDHVADLPHPASNSGEAPPDSAANNIEEPQLLHSVEPFDPHSMYSKYLDDANAGDPASQLIVYSALNACKGKATASDVERLRNAGTSAEQMDRIVARYHSCKDLYAEVPDLRQSYKQWLNKAVEGNDPVAKLLKASWRGRLDDDIKTIIRDALSAEYKEPYIAGMAYFSIVMLYANATPYENIFHREAWNVMSCKSNYNCDDSRIIEDLKQRYHQHEYDEILELTSTFGEHIREQNWDELGF